MGVKLGQQVTDRYNGFTGIVMGRTEYINGCVRYLVESPTLTEKGEAVTRWVDEQRLTEMPAATAGGPQDDAPRY
jgi:hypothetical protein